MPGCLLVQLRCLACSLSPPHDCIVSCKDQALVGGPISLSPDLSETPPRLVDGGPASLSSVEGERWKGMGQGFEDGLLYNRAGSVSHSPPSPPIPPQPNFELPRVGPNPERLQVFLPCCCACARAGVRYRGMIVSIYSPVWALVIDWSECCSTAEVCNRGGNAQHAWLCQMRYSWPTL